MAQAGRSGGGQAGRRAGHRSAPLNALRVVWAYCHGPDTALTLCPGVAVIVDWIGADEGVDAARPGVVTCGCPEPGQWLHGGVTAMLGYTGSARVCWDVLARLGVYGWAPGVEAWPIV